MDDPHMLVMQPFHLSTSKAYDRVVSTLLAFNQQMPAAGWNSVVINWSNGSTQTFDDLVREARELGIVIRMQKHLDKKDAVFGGTIDEMSTQNHQISLTTEFAGEKKTKRGPGRTAVAEWDLTEDVLEFRRLTCAHSNEYNFRRTCRYFRAYVFTCMSIIDAFVNRYAIIARTMGESRDSLDMLERATKFDERLALWFKLFSSEPLDSLHATKAWCHLREMQSMRNRIVHSVDIVTAYAIPEMQLILNRVRTAIGGTLLFLRNASGGETLGFIERLRTSPLVDYNKITFRGDGRHHVKKINGSC